MQIGISIQQVAQQAMNEDGEKIFDIFWQEDESCIARWARWEAQRKGLVELERRCQDVSREIQMLNKRQEIFQNAIEGKLRVQDRASERMQDQIIEEIKELVHTKTEEPLQLAEKEHDLWMYQNEKRRSKNTTGRQETEEARGEDATTVEESEWRLEPEGGAKVPVIIIVSDALEGTFVDLDGESRHEQIETKLSRRGREMFNEGEETRSPKRKVIWVESEETQDLVREEKGTEFEEEEERTFIQSAVSVPLKPLFRCDKQCSEKTLSYWQLASVVMNEGDEAYTTNLCQKCFSKLIQAKGETPLSNVQWRQVVEKKAYRARLWKMLEKEPYLRGMWEHFSCKRS